MKFSGIIAKSVLLLILLGLFYMEYGSRLFDLASDRGDDQLSLAVVADLSGPSAFTGQSHVNGVQLYVDEFNRQGGLNGKRIKVKPFDDCNDCLQSPMVAEQIAADPTIIGVVGHNYSSASLAGSEIYKREGVPAITPSSSNPKITIENPWYFRSVIESDLEAQLSAYYAKAVLKSDRVCIISEDLPYGADLTIAFKENMHKLGMDLACDIQFAVDSETLEDDLKGIIGGLKERQDKLGVIYLATHVGEGATLVREIKDQGVTNDILAPSSFYNHTFKTAFDEMPKERANPGFYSEGVFVTTPLLFDTANRAAQEYLVRYEERFGSTPGWHSAFSYDSAKVFLQAAVDANIDQQQDSIQTIREKVRNALRKFNSRDTAVQGVTGATFFNEAGDTFKPIFVARFKRNQPISASTQLQLAPNISDRKLLTRLTEEGRLVKVKDFYLQETHVVQCGVSINKVEELDTEAVTSLLDFYIWFRHPKGVDPTNIEFVNALDDIDLAHPVVKQEEDGVIYQLYRVKGRFRGDFVHIPDNFDRNSLGLSFHHSTLDRNRLVFVTDVLGMGLIDSTVLVSKLNEGQVLPQGRKLKVFSALVYQDIVSRATMGQGTYLPGLDGMVDFSRFNFVFTVGEHHVSLRRNLPVNSFWLMVGATVLLLLVPFLSARIGPSCGTPNLLWWTTAIGLFALLLAAELVALNYFSMGYIFDQSHVVKAFDVLWWIVPAVLFLQAFEVIVWCPLEKKTGNRVPSIVRLFLKTFVYLMVIFGIIAFVFDQKITSLLATSGVIAMILGLALQVNLSNIFSGLAISLERPFKIGDWIQIDGMEAAKVVEMNWRTVRLMTVCDTIYCVPNSKAAESTVLNYHSPDDYYWLYFPIYVSSLHSPDHVMKVIMDALLGTDVVQKHMGPIVRMDYTEKGIAYYPIFLLKGYGTRAGDKNAVSKNIWKHLHRAGMTPTAPRKEIHRITHDESGYTDKSRTPITIIEENPVFQQLPDETRENLAVHTMLRFYKRGETIFRQGDTATSMFIIAEGIVSLRILSESGEDHLSTASLAPGGGVKWDRASQEEGRRTCETNRLGVGETLGELALLDNTPYTADAIALSDCTLLEITSDALEPLTGQDPNFSAHFAKHILEHRGTEGVEAASPPGDDLKAGDDELS